MNCRKRISIYSPKSSELFRENIQTKIENKKKKTKRKCLNFKNWSETDDFLLKNLYKIYGNKWKIISTYFPTRTPYQLCYRIKSLKLPVTSSWDFDNDSENLSQNENDKYFKGEDRGFPFDLNKDIEESFFARLQTIKKAYELFEYKDSFKDLNLNENEDILFNDNYSKQIFIKKIVYILSELINDVGFLHMKYIRDDKNKHFLTLMRTCIRVKCALEKERKCLRK